MVMNQAMSSRLSLRAGDRRIAGGAAITICAVMLAACGPAKNENVASDLIVVRATAAGKVERVLVNEGADVKAGGDNSFAFDLSGVEDTRQTQKARAGLTRR